MSMTRTHLAILLAISLCPAVQSCGEKNTTTDSDTPWEWEKKDDEKPSGGDEKQFYPKAAGSYRLVTYNVGSFSKYMTNSTDMVAAMLKEIEADIVSINELDSVNTRHNVNQIYQLAQAMGNWNWYFGRAMAYKGGAYGNGVLTSAKLTDKYTVTLDKASGAEQRSLAVVETDKYIFGAAHLDHKSAEAQAIQVRIINAWAQSKCVGSDRPVFFCGDMNAYPDSETLSLIKESWDILSSTDNTFNSTSPSNCIDYIFHYKKSASVKVVGSSVMTKFNNGDVTQASDHLPVYVDIESK